MEVTIKDASLAINCTDKGNTTGIKGYIIKVVGSTTKNPASGFLNYHQQEICMKVSFIMIKCMEMVN